MTATARIAAIALAALGCVRAEASPTVRDLATDGNVLYAAGDAGTFLRSDDSGRTWRALPSDANDHYRRIVLDGQAVFLIGGRALPGHPARAGLARLVRTDVRASARTVLHAPPLGWLYGGTASGRGVGVYGEATAEAPSGVARSATGGARWTPASTETSGYLLGGDFLTWRNGYALGNAGRVVSLRALQEPPVHPPLLGGVATLRAGAFAGPETFWAVGDGGTVLSRRPGDRPWTPVTYRLPPDARSLADWRAVAFADANTAWIAGGLAGVVLHTADGGRRVEARPAPLPGGVHDLLALDADRLLAAGDAGRIWTSDDAGRSWTLRHGPERTDVLFVVSAPECGYVPALVAHSLAGCTTGVVFVTRPPDKPRVPAAQALLASAGSAGASLATVLPEFPSPTLGAADSQITGEAILDGLSARLDTPARARLVRKIAAAIRTHRPTVLAAGPSIAGGRGRIAEARLVGRLTMDAVDLAADASAEPFAALGLPPHRPDRVFVAHSGNERWTPPWSPSEGGTSDLSGVILHGDSFPAGGDSSLEMLAMRALWARGAGLLDRPARQTAYYLPEGRHRGGLMTSGLTRHRPGFRAVSADRRRLASNDALRLLAAEGRIEAAASTLLPASSRPDRPLGDDPLLTADRILLLRWHALATGKPDVTHTLDGPLMEGGQAHPLHARWLWHRLAMSVSSEARAARTAIRPHRPADAPDGESIRERIGAMAPWTRWAPGMALRARALAVEGRGPAGEELLKALSAPSQPAGWRRYALTRLGERLPPPQPPLPALRAAPVSAPGRLDGSLTESAWSQAQPLELVDRDSPPGAGSDVDVRALRSPTHLLLGLGLADRPGLVWSVEVSLDSDRDAWTRLVLAMDTLGKRSARLASRFAPDVPLSRNVFAVQGRRSDGRVVLELAVPLAAAGPEGVRAARWGVQVRAEARQDDRVVRELILSPGLAGPPCPADFGELILRGSSGGERGRARY
jgi:photosystem II stability/assembly factor-like uncharacterized protein